MTARSRHRSFIDEAALAQIQPGVRPDELGFLNAFDANRDKYAPRLPGFTYAVAGGLTTWARPTFERSASIRRADLPQSRPSAIGRRPPRGACLAAILSPVIRPRRQPPEFCCYIRYTAERKALHPDWRKATTSVGGPLPIAGLSPWASK